MEHVVGSHATSPQICYLGSFGMSAALLKVFRLCGSVEGKRPHNRNYLIFLAR